MPKDLICPTECKEALWKLIQEVRPFQNPWGLPKADLSNNEVCVV
jgi:hypothetical protein